MTALIILFAYLAIGLLFAISMRSTIKRNVATIGYPDTMVEVMSINIMLSWPTVIFAGFIISRQRRQALDRAQADLDAIAQRIIARSKAMRESMEEYDRAVQEKLNKPGE